MRSAAASLRRGSSKHPAVTIRDARPADHEHLVRCLEAMQAWMVEIDPWERLRRAPDRGRMYLRRLREQTTSHEGFILVAEADGRPAGAAFALVRRFPAFERLAERPTRMGYLSDLSVLPPWRGRGIGTRLLQEVEARFRRAGCDQTSLGVFGPNEGARRLYDRMGYSMRGMFMVKRLGPAPRRWPSERGRRRPQ